MGLLLRECRRLPWRPRHAWTALAGRRNRAILEASTSTEEQKPEPPCKPGSVPPEIPAAADIHLGRALPRASSEPYPEARAGRPTTPALRQVASLFALAPGGVCLATDRKSTRLNSSH